MGTFLISKRFDDRYKFVFTSRKGKIIFTSSPFELKMDCEKIIEEIKSDIDKYTYLKSKASNGKYFFKIMTQDTVIASSRKYSTQLLLEKGINEFMLTAAKSEVLDFSINDFFFVD